MMKFRLRLLSVSIAAGLAATSPPSWAIDLAQAFRDALANDAITASSRSNLMATRERVLQARAGVLPAVNGAASVSRQATDTNLAPTRQFTSQNYSISMSYPLYRLANIETYEQSRLSVAIAEAQYEQTQQDLMIRVAQAYFDVLASEDSLRTIQSQKRAITEQLASAKRNFEVGTATITDQQEAQARFDLTVAQELAAENDLLNKRAILALLIGKPVTEVNVLREGVTLDTPTPAREIEWTDNARQNNLQVQQAQVASEIARREIDRQRYGNWPTVDLVASTSRSISSAVNFLGVTSQNFAVGVQLNVPIYNGGLVDARVREAAALRDKALTDLENFRRVAEQSTRTAFLGVNSGLAQVRALEAAERSSRLALDSNVLGYQVGVRINIDVLNALQQLFTTRRDLARARYDVIVNGLRLKQAAGTLREEDLQAITTLLGPRPPERPESPILMGPSVPSPGTPAAPATSPVMPPITPPLPAAPPAPRR